MSTVSPIPQHLNPTTTPYPQSTPRTNRRLSPNSSPQHHSSPGSPRQRSSGTLDVDAILRANNGDVRRALEVVVNERNSLQGQNSQLWKLIEKQRAQTAHLAADNERLRTERERANGRLIAAGLDPVTLNGKPRLPSSSSAAGLGLRAETPQIRRHNSDREEKRKENTSLQIPLGSVSAPHSPSEAPSPTVASPSEPAAPGALLPSPMPESKLRHESRMLFPAEVSSFMALAESPRETSHNIPSKGTFNTLSPASQYSASPSVSGNDDGPLIPPPSSRTLAVTTEVEEPAHSEDMEKTSVKDQKAGVIQSRETGTPASNERPSDDSNSSPSTLEPSLHRPSHDTARPSISEDVTRPTHLHPQPSRQTLPQLSAALLPHTRLSIPSSTVYTNPSGRDVLCFIVAITVRHPNAQPIAWNVGKLFSAFIDLDANIKAKSKKGRKEWKQMVAPLPDGRAWKDFAPSKIDQRKQTLELYLQSLLTAPLSDKSDLCDFLSTDPVKENFRQGRKEGYLTKKGKNFGGWKTRFFVLDGPIMEYYESVGAPARVHALADGQLQRGGSHLGSIQITGAQIGRQNRPTESMDERDFRHAFLIIEARKGGSNRHVLCAESDMERDSWIDKLVKHVDPAPGPPPQITSAPAKVPASHPSTLQRQRSTSISVRKSSKDVVVTAAQPISSLLDSNSKLSGAPSPSLFNSMESKRAQQAHSQAMEALESSSAPARMTALQPIKPPPQQSTTTPAPQQSNPSFEVLSTSPPTAEPTSKASNRQSMMVPTRQTYTPAYLSKLSAEGLSAPPGYPTPPNIDRKAKRETGRFWNAFSKTPEKISRPVFGVPLVDSIAIATVANLPAVVFRCIEYLEAKKAELEEGIYRLSGSSAVIKGLKDRFDLEGDVNLLQGDEFWDLHAIAGLLKTFLRDQPTSLLTRELHMKFLAVMDLIDSSARVAELSRLVSELPPPNYALLRALTAHLILIVKNAAINKMTLRNIGIVFSPTLGIPAGIFSELVSHFGQIFDDEDVEIDEVESESILSVPSDAMEETIKRKRNSMLYQAGGADVMLGLAGRSLDPGTEDSASEASMDDLESTASCESLSHAATQSQTTPKADAYPSAAAVRKAKAAARGLGVTTRADATTNTGLGVGIGTETESGLGTANSSNRTAGLPVSPRPGYSPRGDNVV
ncbi:RalA-binding protein 1, partial [Tremellales sp. Uapishka_1]